MNSTIIQNSTTITDTITIPTTLKLNMTSNFSSTTIVTILNTTPTNTTLSSTTSDLSYLTIKNLNRTLDIVEIYFIIVLFLLGFTSNIISYRLIKRNNCFSNLNTYFKYLTIVDFLIICLQIFTKFIFKLNVFVAYLTSFYCKFYIYNLFCYLQLTTWLIILITINQYINIFTLSLTASNNNNTSVISVNSGESNTISTNNDSTTSNNTTQNNRILSTLKNQFQKNSIATIVLLFAILNIPSIYFTNVFRLKTSTSTTLINSYLFCGISRNYSNAFYVINFLFLTIIPYFMILILTLFLALLIFIPNNRYIKFIKQAKQFQFVMITLFLNLFYLITYLPINYLILYTNAESSGDDDSNSDLNNNYLFISLEILLQINLNINYTIIYLFIYFYSSFKIVIYLCLNEIFTEKFKILLFKCKNRFRFNRYQQQHNQTTSLSSSQNDIHVYFNNNNNQSHQDHEVTILQRGYY